MQPRVHRRGNLAHWKHQVNDTLERSDMLLIPKWNILVNHMDTWVHEMDYDQSEHQGVQDEYNEESMSSSSSSDIYVRGPDLMQMLEPIHDALDSSQAAEDTLFEHIRNILDWKESIDSSLLQVQAAMNPMMITEKISEDAKSAISQHIMMFNKTMQEWQTKMSCDMMDMIQRGKIDTTGVSEELKRVWTQLSEGLNMLHKNTMELQSKFALV